MKKLHSYVTTICGYTRGSRKFFNIGKHVVIASNLGEARNGFYECALSHGYNPFFLKRMTIIKSVASITRSSYENI